MGSHDAMVLAHCQIWLTCNAPVLTVGVVVLFVSLFPPLPRKDIAILWKKFKEGENSHFNCQTEVSQPSRIMKMGSPGVLRNLSNFL